VPVLHELYKLLTSTDAVNWELARQVAVALASHDEPLGEIGAAQAELEGMSRAATAEAEVFSGLVTETVAPVTVVSRTQWVEANIDSFKFLMNPLAEKMSAGGEIPLPGQIGQVLRQISSVFLGLQTGMVLGYLGRTVIGQYEVSLPQPEGVRLLYVLPNLREVERDWELDPKEFRYWIALHEVTHHLEFSRPWVRNYFHSQLRTLVDSLDFDPTRMQTAFEGIEMLDPERMAEALQDPEKLVQAAWTPLSKDAMARLQSFMTLAEGYATFVMDAVGARVLKDHPRLKEVMERRKREASPGDVLLERLLGLELKRRQYEEGVKFCRYVAGVRDIPSLNRAWDNPDSLPTSEELADPDAWITRVLEES
jgi:coenzyme F420 biosynthesis associated uncharacterized protein